MEESAVKFAQPILTPILFPSTLAANVRTLNYFRAMRSRPQNTTPSISFQVLLPTIRVHHNSVSAFGQFVLSHRCIHFYYPRCVSIKSWSYLVSNGLRTIDINRQGKYVSSYLVYEDYQRYSMDKEVNDIK